MNQKIVKMAEALGINTKGLTETAIMEKIDQYWANEKSELQEQSLKEAIENGSKKLSEFKKAFETPFGIMVKKVGAGIKPEAVQVVGYIQEDDTIIVYKDKLYSFKASEIITSKKQHEDILAQIKADRAKKALEAKMRKENK